MLLSSNRFTALSSSDMCLVSAHPSHVLLCNIGICDRSGRFTLLCCTEKDAFVELDASWGCVDLGSEAGTVTHDCLQTCHLQQSHVNNLGVSCGVEGADIPRDKDVAQDGLQAGGYEHLHGVVCMMLLTDT